MEFMFNENQCWQNFVKNYHVLLYITISHMKIIGGIHLRIYGARSGPITALPDRSGPITALTDARVPHKKGNSLFNCEKTNSILSFIKLSKNEIQQPKHYNNWVQCVWKKMIHLSFPRMKYNSQKIKIFECSVFEKKNIQLESFLRMKYNSQKNLSIWVQCVWKKIINNFMLRQAWSA